MCKNKGISTTRKKYFLNVIFFKLLFCFKKPTWWIVLFLIPIANFIVLILINLEIAKKFGQSSGFGIGMSFLPFIFWPMLGFGSAVYDGGSKNNADHLIS